MTDVQRKVLLWVADAGGELFITTGYKTTRLGHRKTTGESAVATSVVVLEPLVRRGWLRRTDTDGAPGIAAGAFALTDVGREAVAPKGKWPLRKVRPTSL